LAYYPDTPYAAFFEKNIIPNLDILNTPVSTTPAKKISTSFASVVDTGGKFATGFNDTGG
jgi:hypothetical protein